MTLTAGNTAIVLDSTADYGEPQRDHANWRMVPLTVRFGEETFLDHVQMPPEEFYRRLAEASELPQTAAPAPGAYAEMYQSLAGYQQILVLPVSFRV